MIEPSRLRGVIFDMDGVLVDSEPFLAEAAIRMFAEKGFEVKPAEFHPFVGMGEDRYLGGPAEARDIPIDPAKDKARTYALYLDLIRGKLHPLPGVREFVARCREKGLLLAVASSADAIKVEGNLHEIGLPASTTANAPTVFPNAAYIKNSRNYYQYKNQEELTAWNNLFLPITQGS